MASSQFMKIILVALLACLPAMATAQTDTDLVAGRIAQFNTQLPNSHPRLLLRPADLPALREFIKAAAAQPDDAALAKLALPPPTARPLTPEPRAVRNGTPENTALWRAGYGAANEAGTWAQRYALAWLISQDAAYGREAARWLLHLASWTIDRDTYRINDEIFIQSLRPMIFAYDWAYDALSDEERRIVREALVARMKVLAGQVKPKFSLTRPTPADGGLSHPMRFISTLGQGGLALYHESADAPDWLAWSYEYYLRQFPVWGGPAGGWAEGLNYWSTGISQHQRFLDGMALLGFDEPLQRPFWRNTPYFGIYSLMPYGGSSFGDLSNIVKPNSSIALMMEKFAVLNGDPYAMAFARSLGQKRELGFSYYSYNGTDAVLQAFRTAQARLPQVSLADLPQSRYFDDIGVVTMHSNLGDAAQDIMLGFRASPQGSVSHGFSDQNSFVLNAYGQPLAINSGYREFYGSDHHVNWSRQTKAKNALLFDGKGQAIKDASATGRISRYAEGKRFTFATGDALPAYGANASRALRHVFFVDRRYFLIFDEAAAPRAVPYQWRLHARSQMQLIPERNEIIQQQGDARLSVRFLLPGPDMLNFSQTDAFDPPVVASYQKQMPNEWHVSAETRLAARDVEFLSLLYPWHSTQAQTLPQAHTLQAGKGHAVRLVGPGRDDIVLLAREDEKQVDTGPWQLAGMAASISQQGDTLRVALVDSTRLSGLLRLQSSLAFSGEAQLGPGRFALEAQLPAPLKLLIDPGFGVTSVDGAQHWQRLPDGSLSLSLAAGPLKLLLR